MHVYLHISEEYIYIYFAWHAYLEESKNKTRTPFLMFAMQTPTEK